MRLVTPEQMRMLEARSDESGVSYETLMERAGKNLSAVIQRQISRLNRPRVLLLCGNGNNGGDCFVAARHLFAAGCAVTAALVCGVPKTILAYQKYKQLGQVPVLTAFREILTAAASADVIVDGVYGTGFHGELRPELQQLFSVCARHLVIGVDVPSGGDADSGRVSAGAMQCRITVTFGACKFGMAQYPLKGLCGEILVADIGLPDALFDGLTYPVSAVNEGSVCHLLPKRAPDAHKGQFGKLLCVTGSGCMPGAAALSTKAALRCGVGLLRLATAPSVAAALSANCHEPMFLPLRTDESGYITFENYDAVLTAANKSTALLLGCGLGVTDDTKKLVRALVRTAECPIVLDADGINCVAGCIDILQEVKSGIVLTPHAAEMARLLDTTPEEVQEDRMAAASDLAKRTGAVIVLKGAGTVIATPDRAFVNSTGNPGMSKGGSGDVLAGMIASFAAQGLSAEYAAILGVFLHGLAGDCAAKRLSVQAMLPSDLIDELPERFLQLEQKQLQEA